MVCCTWCPCVLPCSSHVSSTSCGVPRQYHRPPRPPPSRRAVATSASPLSDGGSRVDVPAQLRSWWACAHLASVGDEGRVSCPVGRLRARRGGQEARFSTRLLWPVAWVFAGRCVGPHAPGSAPWVTARCPTVSPDPTWRYLAKDRVLRRDTGPPFSFLATCLPVLQRWATQAGRGRRPPPPSAAAVAPRCPPLGHAGERGAVRPAAFLVRGVRLFRFWSSRLKAGLVEELPLRCQSNRRKSATLPPHLPAVCHLSRRGARLS